MNARGDAIDAVRQLLNTFDWVAWTPGDGEAEIYSNDIDSIVDAVIETMVSDHVHHFVAVPDELTQLASEGEAPTFPFYRVQCSTCDRFFSGPLMDVSARSVLHQTIKDQATQRRMYGLAGN